MATKRRKMWAVVDDEGRGSQVFLSLKAAKRWAAKEPRDGTGWHVVAYLERLPGDVVLSRKDVDTTANDVAREMLARGYTARMADEVGTIVATYLLRGRR